MAGVEEEDALPPNWVKRCSRRRQAQVYYFNTMTGESSWTRPTKYENNGEGANRGRHQPPTSDKRSSSDSDDEQLFKGAAKKLMKSIERPCREVEGKQVEKNISERLSSNAEVKQCSNSPDYGQIKCLQSGLQSVLEDGKGENEDINSEKRVILRKRSASPSVCTEEKIEVKPKSSKILDAKSCSNQTKEKNRVASESCQLVYSKRKSSSSCSRKRNKAKGKNVHSQFSDIISDQYYDSLDKEALGEDKEIESRISERHEPPKPCAIAAEATQGEENIILNEIEKKTISENCIGEVKKNVHNHLTHINQVQQRENEGEEKNCKQIEQKDDVKDGNVGEEEAKVESTEKCKPASVKKFKMKEYNGKMITIGKITKPSKSSKVSFKIEKKKKEILSKLCPVFKEKDAETKPVFRIPKKKLSMLDQLKNETISERKAQIIRKVSLTLTEEEYKELTGSERQKSSVDETEKLYEQITRLKGMNAVSQITEARTEEKHGCIKECECKSYVDQYEKDSSRLRKEISDSKRKDTFKETEHEPKEKKTRRSHVSRSSDSESSHGNSSREKSSRSRSSRRERKHRKSSPSRDSSGKKYDVKTKMHMEEKDDYQSKVELPEGMSLQTSEVLHFGPISSSEILPYENENFTEDMEVETTEIISEITNFRDTAPILDEKNENWKPDAAKTLEKSNVVNCLTLYEEGSKPILFVVDTNILIEDLTYLEKLCQFSFHGRELVIVVPYGAIQELDGLKQSNKVGLQSQKAIKWCNQKFLGRDRRVIGQTFMQYKLAAQTFQGQSGDDRIRDCALQLKQSGVDVVLLSNDINLLNKALLADLNVSNLDSLKEKLADSMKSLSTDEVNKPSHYSEFIIDNGNQKKEKSACSLAMNVQILDKEEMKNADIVDKIKVMLKGTLGKILEHYMKEMFENLWLQIILVKPPWTLDDIFLCLEKHWLAVFIDPFPSQVRTWIKETAELCKKTKLTTPQVKKLLTLVEDLYKVFRLTCESLVVEPPTDFDTSHINSDNSESSVVPVPSDVLLLEQSENDLAKSPSAIGKEVSLPQTEIKEVQQSLSVPFPVSRGTECGTQNLQEMIKSVGQCMEQYVTKVTDYAAKSFYMQSQEPPPFTLNSLQNLGQSIKTFGSAVVESLNEANDEVIMKLGTFLTEFWSDANLPCPSLPFTPADIQEFLSVPSGRSYLEEVTKELERFFHVLESTYQRFTASCQ